MAAAGADVKEFRIKNTPIAFSGLPPFAILEPFKRQEDIVVREFNQGEPNEPIEGEGYTVETTLIEIAVRIYSNRKFGSWMRILPCDSWRNWQTQTTISGSGVAAQLRGANPRDPCAFKSRRVASKLT